MLPCLPQPMSGVMGRHKTKKMPAVPLRFHGSTSAAETALIGQVGLIMTAAKQGWGAAPYWYDSSLSMGMDDP